MRNVLGTPQNDNLINSQNDDVLEGIAGNDTLHGNAGNDTLIGLLGDDYLQGDNPQFIKQAGGLVLGGTPMGDDLLLGEEGNDTLFGSAGNDTLDGGEGEDFASYRLALTGVFVDLNTSIAFDGLGGTDTLISIENIRGSELNDTLIGNAEDNILDATTGGADIRQVGWGDDTYILNAQASGGSPIIDDGAEDTLILTNADEISCDRQGTTAIINLSSKGEVNPNPIKIISILNYYASDVGDEPGIASLENITNDNGQELSATSSHVGTRFVQAIF